MVCSCPPIRVKWRYADTKIGKSAYLTTNDYYFGFIVNVPPFLHSKSFVIVTVPVFLSVREPPETIMIDSDSYSGMTSVKFRIIKIV